MSQKKKGFVEQILGSSLSKFQWLIIIAGVGIGFMIFTSFLSVQNEIDPSIDPPQQSDNTKETLINEKETDEMEVYQEEYESELKDILEKVVGVSNVSVMVNIASTEEIVVEKNTNTSKQVTKETDQQNATRNVTESTRDEEIVLYDSGKGQRPVIRKTLKPTVRGVLVVAKGAENLQVKAWVLEAVQRVLDIPAYKISVLPKKG